MNSSHKIVYTATAKADLREIRDFIALDSVDAAIRFIRELATSVQTLDFLPERCPVIPEVVTLMYDTYRHLIHKSYRIIFAIRADQVMILRIVHGARVIEADSL